jgi:hypothetical protein
MNLELTEEEAAALLRELDAIIAADRYFLSPRITTLKAIRRKIRPEPERESRHPHMATKRRCVKRHPKRPVYKAADRLAETRATTRPAQ